MQERKIVRDAVVMLLELGCGFELDLFAMLSIHRLEDGRYRIFNTNPHNEDTNFLTNENYEEDIEEIYEDLDKAVDRFLDIREDRCIGSDFKDDWLRRENDEDENG